MRIQHNIAALNSYRNLTGNNAAVSKNLEKLSSGYRINRAGDDAAGLAISEKMRAQITGLETAQKNANDGISLVQTAEGALTEVHSMLNRMVELADQSSNGTYQDAVDRENLQKEVNSLKEEIDRISESTNFNGINLLDGSLSGNGTSGGGLVGGTIGVWKAATHSGNAKDATAGGDAINFDNADTFIIDGTEVKVDWSTLSSEDKASLSIDWTSNTSGTTAKKAAKIMEDTINAAIDKVNQEANTSVSHISIQALDTAKGFKITSGLSGSGASSLAIKGLSDTNATVANRMFSTDDADSATDLKPLGSATSQLTINPANCNGKFNILIDGEAVEIELAGLANNSTGADIVTKLNTALGDALGHYDTAKGNTGDDVISGKITAKFNNNGQLEFTNTSGKKIGFEDKDGNDFAKTLGISAEGKAVSGGGLVLQIGDTADDFNKLTVSVANMSSGSLGIGSINVNTQQNASNAVEKIKNAINIVSSTRGDLGAIQNRLEHTINNLGVTTENMTAAESRIRDVDMADEMMSYTKNNILVQASQAMLAQANQLPQGVLQLLQ